MYTTEAEKWINLLIKERISNELIFIQNEGNNKIYCKGSDKYIEFENVDKGFLCKNYHPKFAMWNSSKEGWLGQIDNKIPSPGLSIKNESLIEKLVNGYKIKYDIIGFIYWTLNRIEENKDTCLDKHQRYKIVDIYSMENGYYERPVVDEWIDILIQVTKKLWKNIEINKTKFRIWVSHDVDRPSRYAFTSMHQLFRKMGGDIVKRGNIKGALMAPLIRIYPKNKINQLDPWNKFEWLMSVSEKNNLKSTFFFMTNKYNNNYDNDYQINDKKIKWLLKIIAERKHEIGLHPSYYSYLSKDKLLKESQQLIKECRKIAEIEKWGARMHYLRWKQPETLELLESIGASYDSSMTFEERPGFRCGTCHEYTGYSSIKDKILNIRVRPLIVMEEQITEAMGLGLGETAFNKFIEIKNICRKYNGEFSMLWHNSYLDTSYKRELYEQVIKN